MDNFTKSIRFVLHYSGNFGTITVCGQTKKLEMEETYPVPTHFSEWISEPVFGISGTPNVGFTYRIYKTTDGKFALQEKRQVIKVRRNNPIEYEVIATGDWDIVFAKHMEYTEKPPVFLHKS